eukprot:4349342-Pyramimonas_sp.AAC.1
MSNTCLSPSCSTSCTTYTSDVLSVHCAKLSYRSRDWISMKVVSPALSTISAVPPAIRLSLSATVSFIRFWSRMREVSTLVAPGSCDFEGSVAISTRSVVELRRETQNATATGKRLWGVERTLAVIGTGGP